MNDDIEANEPLEPIDTVEGEQTEPVQSLEDAVLEGMDLDADDKIDEPAEPAAKVEPKAEKAKPELKTDGKLTEEDLQAPENTSNKGRARFEKLVNGYKAESAKVEQLTGEVAQYKDSFKALQDLGFKDEQSAQDLMMFAKFRQSMQGDGKEAMEILQRQIRNYELKTGTNIQASALESHGDLADAVRNDQLPYANALEIAKARDQLAAQQQQVQTQQNNQYQQYQVQQQHLQATDSVDQLEASWQATDPDYSLIRPHIMAAMPDIARQFPANQWPAQVNMLYQATKRAMSAQPRRTQTTLAPLRGNANAASRPAARSMQEAVLMGMGLDV